MSKNILYGFILVSILFTTSASFGKETPKIIPTVFIKMGPYLLTEDDMAGYQLTQTSLHTWPMAPKGAPPYRALMGAQQVWTSSKINALTMSYGEFDSPEEALEAATVFMARSKRTFHDGALTWQKEEDKSWTFSALEKESIVFVRGKFTLIAEISVDTEANRAENASEVEHSILKVLGKIEAAAAKTK